MSDTQAKHPFLEYAQIDHFGAWSHQTIGPFESHLNVVFGPNEAGKTTLSSFIGGVLFGWKKKTREENNYKPEDAERSGSLLFTNDLELHRVRNADGLQGDTELVDDIDQETYDTVFSLTSDELSSLNDKTDITSRLLTAGSGTYVSPAEALDHFDNDIKKFVSTSKTAENSLVQLANERKEVKAKMKEAENRAEQYREHEQELHECQSRYQEEKDRKNDIDDEIDQLSKCGAHLQEIDDEIIRLENDIKEAQKAEQQLQAKQSDYDDQAAKKFLDLSDVKERVMYEQLDTLSEGATKRSHALDLARESYNTSKAAYEALEESSGSSEPSHRPVSKTLQIIVLVVMFAVFLFVGAYVLMSGLNAGSLSYIALGSVLAIVGVGLAVAAVVCLFRTGNKNDEDEDRIQNAREDMLQDEKKLNACLDDEQNFTQQVKEELIRMGFDEVDASIKQAREILNEAKTMRSNIATDQQHKQQEQERIENAEERRNKLFQQRDQLFMQINLPVDTTFEDIEDRLKKLRSQQAELGNQVETDNHRLGELENELAQAQYGHDFDQLKNQYHELKTRQNLLTRDFAQVLLARHILDKAIESWKSKSQPEVYVKAGQLLALMTDGRWTRIEMTDNNELTVCDDARNSREVRLLSTGTRQQLYLSLRIALLMCADSVGRAIPLIADDILVNFDARRRIGAARALAELAQTRQVIVLTCHEEVVQVLKDADKNVNVIEL